MNLARIRRVLTAPIIAVVVSLAIASLALLVAGYNPVVALQAMWSNLDGADGVASVLNYGARYYVMGVAVAVGFKMNLFNIGANGQYQIAALFAGAAGGVLRLPGVLNILIMIVVALVAGGIWAVIPGVLNVTRKVNIVKACFPGCLISGSGWVIFPQELLEQIDGQPLTRFDILRFKFNILKNIPLSKGVWLIKHEGISRFG